MTATSIEAGAWLQVAWEAFRDLVRIEREAGRAEARRRLAGLRDAYLALKRPDEPPLIAARDEALWELARTRGVWVLWMLREATGPAFDLACETWLAEGAPATVEQLLAQLGRADEPLAGQLRWWIATVDLPDYRLRAAAYRRVADGYEVALRLVNVGAGGVPVPLEVRTEEGARHAVTVSLAAGERLEVRYPLLTRPIAAAVDPDGVVLTRGGPGHWRRVRPRWPWFG